MIPLLCLMTAGIIMGHFFNVYFLAAASFVVAFAIVLSGIGAGFAQAATLTLLVLCCLQFGYFLGMIASSRLYSSRPFSLPSRR